MVSSVILSCDNHNLFFSHECAKLKYAKVLVDRRFVFLKVFDLWGFGEWSIFKKIVMHFYPEVNELHLKEFYEGSVIREDVIKYIDYTYQILNI